MIADFRELNWVAEEIAPDQPPMIASVEILSKTEADLLSQKLECHLRDCHRIKHFSGEEMDFYGAIMAKNYSTPLVEAVQSGQHTWHIRVQEVSKREFMDALDINDSQISDLIHSPEASFVPSQLISKRRAALSR